LRKKETEKKGKIIDLGCSTGTFLSVAKERGWNVYGIELSTWAVSEAKRLHQLDIKQGSIIAALKNFSDNYFDVVVLFDVIEHLEAPGPFIHMAVQKLRPGGMLVITTPNIESVMARFTKERWYAIVPSHLIYFSPKTVKQLLHRYSLQAIDIQTHTRFFSLGYIGFRLQGFSSIIFRIIGVLLKQSLLKGIVIPINFRAEMEVYATK